MTNAARDAGFVARRIHLVVAIDRLLARLLEAAPEQWVVKGGYANQLRRPDDARFTEDLDLKIDAAIEMAPELLASGFAVDLSDDFSYEVASSPVPLDRPSIRNGRRPGY
jgi:predicted nucleotidyltransferase component of viral defense system